MQNLYFRKVIRRDNPFLDFLNSIARTFERPPRLLLCVFLRKEMGERHFNIASASTLGFFLFLPFLFYAFGAYEATYFLIWTRYCNIFWLLFVVSFMVMSYIHHRAQGFSLTKYDFEKFSLSEGIPILPWKKLLGRFNMNARLTPIITETIIEPLAVFIIGIVFFIIPFSRGVGIMFIISAIVYSLSHIGAYWRSRNDILDKNDERIANEDMIKIFMGDIEIPDLPENTRIKLPPILPETKEQKEGLYKQIVVETIGVE